jgi:hypothetical protein
LRQKKLAKAHLIVKFGAYRGQKYAERGAETPPHPAEKGRTNAYLALLVYMRDQAKRIKR